MVNRVILIGNLGKDAEIKQTERSTVANFSIATTERWTDRNGEKQEHTEWHQIALWGKVAEAIGNYLVKGKQVYVEGSIRTEKWTGQDGNERTTQKINASQIKLLGGGGSGVERGNVPSRELDDDPPPF